MREISHFELPPKNHLKSAQVLAEEDREVYVVVVIGAHLSTIGVHWAAAGGGGGGTPSPLKPKLYNLYRPKKFDIETAREFLEYCKTLSLLQVMKYVVFLKAEQIDGFTVGSEVELHSQIAHAAWPALVRDDLEAAPPPPEFSGGVITIFSNDETSPLAIKFRIHGNSIYFDRDKPQRSQEALSLIRKAAAEHLRNLFLQTGAVSEINQPCEITSHNNETIVEFTVKLTPP